MMNLYAACWIVLIYGFIGWCCEVILAAVNHGKFVNRGFLNGPICPIYGFGMLLILTLLSPLAQNLPLLFLGTVLLCTLLEYLTGFILEKFFHEKWWDYSGYPFNLQGYICLKFSLLWGLGGVFVIRIIHPLIYLLIRKMPRLLGLILLLFLLALLLADLVITLIALLKLPRKFKAMKDLEQSMDRLSAEIGGHLLAGTEKVLKIEEKLHLEARYQDLMCSLSYVQKRFLKAFPNLSKNHKKLWDSLKKHQHKDSGGMSK